MDEHWRTLRVGDHVRIVHMPREFASVPDSYQLHPETEELYRHLISKSAVLTVTRIDEWGVPWIDYTWSRQDGTEEFHSLGLNHDGIRRTDAKLRLKITGFRDVAEVERVLVNRLTNLGGIDEIVTGAIYVGVDPEFDLGKCDDVDFFMRLLGDALNCSYLGDVRITLDVQGD